MMGSAEDELGRENVETLHLASLMEPIYKIMISMMTLSSATKIVS